MSDILKKVVENASNPEVIEKFKQSVGKPASEETKQKAKEANEVMDAYLKEHGDTYYR